MKYLKQKTFLVLLLTILPLLISCNSHDRSSAQNLDWLVNGKGFISEVSESTGGKELIMSNGLIERVFRISPDFATLGIKNLVTGHNYVRSVRPEAQVIIGGQRYDIGGLLGQSVHSYILDEWKDSLTSNKGSFQYVDYSVCEIQPRFDWKIRKEWISNDVLWPPKGKELIVEFRAPDILPGEAERLSNQQVRIQGEPVLSGDIQSFLKDVVVKVHYEIYDGLPLISKWITVENNSDRGVVLDRYISEILAVVEGESSVEGEAVWELPNLHVETDYAFSGMSNRKANQAAVHWKTDSTYTSQVNYALKTPCLLQVYPPVGPGIDILPGETFESFRAWELFFDSYDKERKGLSTRKMYRTIAPWVTENPVLMHVRQAAPESVKLSVDQCAEVGFEMVIMTFGSGFNMETGDTAYYRKMKEMVSYAHSKGIALGGYSLLASRSISEKDDIINPATGKTGGIAYYGNSPCLVSEWGIEYFRRIKEMYDQTGLDVIEHDGSYPGDICGSTSHPGHKGLEDSQWMQFQIIRDFYRWCRSRGIYLNVPDWYYMNGSSKCGMGYREVNWSLPRAQQEIIERQNIYDGTWTKTPSMGWMFVPLTQYHGGGEAATIEPLNEHLDHYARRMANLFGAGVQACYRGPRLYDTDSTKAVVKQWVDFYKNHREILDSDIIHLRRPDGQDWDGILHVNPAGREKGLVMLYNPLNREVRRTIQIPVYYTGLSKKVRSTNSSGGKGIHAVSRDYDITLTAVIPAKGYAYYILD